MGRGLERKGQNGHWEKMGKLGEMAFGRNEKGAKMKLGEKAKGQARNWAEWEKGEVGKGEKRMGETEKIRAKWEWVKRDWANWE